MFKLLLIIWVHWFSDFVLQTDKMSTNKSTSLKWLTSHVTVYTIPLFLFGWEFAVINGISHFIIDFCTSRWTSYLYKKGDRHNFFVVIGIDQALHTSILIYTAFRFLKL